MKEQIKLKKTLTKIAHAIYEFNQLYFSACDIEPDGPWSSLPEDDKSHWVHMIMHAMDHAGDPPGSSDNHTIAYRNFILDLLVRALLHHHKLI